ncbi:MAG: S8 family serine peptidase [Clostridia bacterium]|nr:S8 family serine peptidase [Clostridia bacterium]
MRNHTRKILSVLLSLVMVLTLAIPAVSAIGTKSGSALDLIPYDASKLGVKKLGETSAAAAEAAKHAPNETVRVSIVLTGKSTIDAGFSTNNIAKNPSAISYRNALKAEQAKVTAKIEKALGAELSVKRNLTLAMNVISAEVTYGDIAKIEAVAGVDHVIIETAAEPLTTDAADPDMAVSVVTNGSEAAWAEGYYGAGSSIAIVDSGLMDTHISMDPDAFDYAIAEDAENAGITVEDYDLITVEKIADVFDQLNAADDPAINSAEDLYLNSKVPFHYNYVDGGTRTNHVSDDNRDKGSEHGSHVAGIAAANRYIKQDGEFVDAKETVMAVGNAPDAQLLVMKVFGVGGGAYPADYMAAIEDSIILGAASVNLSLGSGNPGSVFAGEYQTVMDKLAESDTVYCGSAGNSYAWDYALQSDYGIYADSISLATAGSPGTSINSLSVAASQNQGVIGKPLVFNDDIYGVFTETSNTGGTIARFEGETFDFVYIDSIGDGDDYDAVAEEIDLEGKAVIVNRGGISFYVKGNNLIYYDPALLIVANNQAGSINMALDDYVGSFPMVAIPLDTANEIKAASEKTEIGGYDVYTGSVFVADQPIAMPSGFNTDPTDFSSWGATGALVLKPEITAPGGSIRSLHAYATEDGVNYSGGEDQYELMSGTSMASPQMAGLVAVLAQYIRENDMVEKTGLTQRQLIQSLMMSTSVPMKDAGGDYYPVLEQGSGLANVQNAILAESFIKMDDNATISAADGKVKAELGQNAARDGKYEFSFVVNNISDEDRTYTVSTDLFTQGIEEGWYDYIMSYGIEALEADIAYTWEQLGEGNDVDLDGDTDEDDVQAILDIVTGIFDADYDEEAADLDGDGDITSRDAYELLLILGGEDEATIPAGGAARVTVSIELTEEEREYLDATRLTAWVEGYTYITCEDDVEHSIPILGVYGSWTDSSMYDAVTAFDAYNGNLWRESYSGNYETNGVVLKNGASTYFFTGNPYLAEPDADPERFAVSSKATISGVKYTLIRNAGTMVAVIFDDEGNILWNSNVEKDVDGMYYYVNGAAWYNNGVSTAAIGEKVKDLGLESGDGFEVKLFAVPEYYALMLDPEAKTCDISLEDLLALYEEGEIGEGAVISMQAKIDTQAPKILSAELSEDGSTVTVTAQDDQYIAAICLMDINGEEIYAGEIPEQSEPGEEVTVELDISDLDMGVAAAVFVGDYAANEDAALIRFSDGPIMAKVTHYYLTETLEEGNPYVITNSNEPGEAAALMSNGVNYYTSSAEVKLIEDANGLYVDDAAIDASIVWDAIDDAVTLENANDGGLLGFNSPNYPFVSWGGQYAGYADSFSYHTPYLDNGYVSIGYYMYYNGGYFMFGPTEGETYIFTPQTFEYEIDPEAASEVIVDPAAVTLILEAKPTVELDVTVKPIVLPDKTVTWSSSDEDVATVDENGVVTAVGVGTAIITATSNQTPSVYGTCVVAVAGQTPIDAYVFAQTTYGKNDMRFEYIDLSTMETEEIAEAGSTFISGAQSGNYIWGVDTDIDVMRYDVETFTPEMMFSLNPTYLALDSANFPNFTANLGDEGEPNLAYYDYYYASVTKNGWLTLWYGETGSNAVYFDLAGDYGINPIAIAFVGAEYDDNDEYITALYYYILDDQSELYLGIITPMLYEGEPDLDLSLYDWGTVNILTIGDDPTAFSMTYAYYQTGEDAVFIADNNMKAIFYVNGLDEYYEFDAAYVGTVAGASSVAGLFNGDYDSIPELSVSQIERIKAKEGEAKTGIAQKADVSLEAAVETAEIETLGAPNRAGKNGEVVTPEQAYTYTVDLTEDVDANNGLIKVTYDPSIVTYVTYKSNLDFESLGVDEENGVILFAFASYDAIPAGETLATIYFASEEEDITVYVHDEEINEELGIVDHEYEGPEWVWEGSDEDGYTAVTAIFTATDEFGLVEELEAELTVLTQEATCTEDGEAIYIATVIFKGVEYTIEKHVVLPALGHDFPEGSADNVCTRCGEGQDCPYCGEHHDLHTISGWWTSLIHHILFILNRILLWWSPIAK